MARPPRSRSTASRTPREEAIAQLDRIERDGVTINDAAAAASLPSDPRAHRQVREYVAGVTRWRRRLDATLDAFYRGDLEGMESTLRQILRLGLYELLYLQTPPHAAISEAVHLAKRLVRPKAGGLVNGLLRNVHRAGSALPEPAGGDEADTLAIRHSHPTWMVRRWLKRYGRSETEALLAWNNARPLYAVRANTLRMSDAALNAAFSELHVTAAPSPYVPGAYRVDALQPIVRGGLVERGECLVQDESAMLIVHAMDPQPGETIVDLCAAPGGKTVYSVALMRNEGRVVACDLRADRLALLEQSLGRLGLAIVEARVMDAGDPDPDLLGMADRVLLDAPCSGLGVLAKRADLRWRRTREELDRVVVLQRRLLAAAARVVKPGGLLVYSTCTIEPEENEQQVDWFLAEHPEFSLEPASAFAALGVTTREGYLSTLPQRHAIDGAFGARLRRKEV